MTVSSPVCSDTYVATGSDSVYPYTWQLLQAADLLVIVTDLAGANTTLALTTDYTISDVGSPLGGDVTIVAGNLTAGYTLTLIRAPAILQELLLQQGAAFNPADLMRSLDLLTMIAQYLQSQLDRALVVPVGTTPAPLPSPEALALLQWNALGTGLQNIAIADLGTLLAAGNYVVDRPAFTAGVTTALTLTQAPGTVNNTAVFFDGVYQQKPTYSVSGVTLTLTSAVPLGVLSVEVVQAGVLPINTPADNSVATATLQNLAVTGPKIAAATIDGSKIAAGTITQSLLDASYLSAAPQYGKNGIINGGALVANRVAFAAPVSGTFAYGKVDRWKGALTGGGLSGTFTQGTGSSLGRTGYTCKWSAVSITGAGTVTWRLYMEARDASRYKNRNASVRAAVRHDGGVSFNAAINVAKATVADNFAAVTSISAGSAQAVATGTNVDLYSRAIAMGDCTNGIYVEVVITLPAGCSNKNFECVELQIEPGDKETDYEYRPIAIDEAACLRYFYPFGCDAGQGLMGFAISTTLANTGWRPFPVVMRANPTASGVVYADWVLSPGAVVPSAWAGTAISVRGWDAQFQTAAVLTANALYRFAVGGVILFDADF